MVVPAYNEEDHILLVLDHSPPMVDHLIVVDDRSTDSTARLVRCHADPRVRLVQHERNLGLGAALVSGYKMALAGEADIVVVMAGDDQMDPRYLPELLSPIAAGTADVAKGNRFFSWTSMRRMPRRRLLGSLVLTWLTRAASGYWRLHDSQNGYIAFSSTALRKVSFAALATGYAVENAMLIQLGATGARLVEVPIPSRYGTETSSMSLLRDGPVILATVLRGIATRWLGQRRR